MGKLALVAAVGVSLGAMGLAGCGEAVPAPAGTAPQLPPAVADKPYLVVNLPAGPSYTGCSNGRIYGQCVTLSRLFVLKWDALQDPPAAIPVLTPDQTVVVGAGRVLGIPSFIDWLHLPGYEKGPVPPKYLSAQKSASEVIALEPYLKEYGKLPGRPVFVRSERKSEADVVEVVAKEWYADRMKASQSGGAVALCLREDCGVTNGDNARRRIRLGVYRDKDKKVSWVDGLRGDRDNDHWPMVEAVALPADGSKVAAIGSNGQGGWAACVDTVKGTILWDLRRRGDAFAFHDGDFSADGKTFYAGGTAGELFAYAAATGERLCKWPVKDRIERVVTSPDGKLIAAGLADGNGTVCLIDPTSGKVVREIVTDSSNIRGLGFSPDSIMLAVAGAGSSQIKIYKLKEQPDK